MKDSKENIDDLDLLLDSYHYDLDPELIAQRPIDPIERDRSRLMIYRQQTGEVIHDYFYNLHQYLPKEALLVFNQSKVFPSRLLGNKRSGGKGEFFFLSHEKGDRNIYTCLIKTRTKKKIGDEFIFENDLRAEIKEIYEDGIFGVEITLPENEISLINYLEKYALIPIPPYIRKGKSDEFDKINYQTVYSKESGSVAAPTAGLHFTKTLLEKLKKEKIDEAYVTLHVGLGTFKPIFSKDLKKHVMHSEDYFIDGENLKKISLKKNIVAVGTTSLRVLESSYGKEIKPNKLYQTKIFLHPGIKIQSISGLITNFHLPESSLLVLVSALIGRRKTLELYQLAMEKKYRFFSYGDAMLILR